MEKGDRKVNFLSEGLIICMIDDVSILWDISIGLKES